MGQLGALEKECACEEGAEAAGTFAEGFQLPRGIWERKPPAREAMDGRLTMLEADCLAVDMELYCTYSSC